MKIRIVLNVEVEPEEWAKANGLAGSRARIVSNDVRSFVLGLVQRTSMVEETGAEVSLSR